jgi:hypothetical protein
VAILHCTMAIRPTTLEHAARLLSILGERAHIRFGPMTTPMSDRYREEP